ncbi:MAG: ATP-binding protein [Aristaeellaceae bacterium]
MNIKQAKEQIMNAMKAYFTKDSMGEYILPAHHQRPVFLMGAPGIGKTAIMEQVASEMGVALLSYSMTHHTRQSALGLPFIVHKEYQGGAVVCDVSEYTMSEIISSIYDLMEETGLTEGILFLDEINCVSETLAPVMLQFLQYKVFGRHRVPDGWMVVTAGNPPEYNSSVRELDIVTWDRLKRIDVEPDFQVWKEYAIGAGVHPAITSYLEIKPAHFYHVQSSVDGKSFVTARGWEDLSRMIRLYELNGIGVDKLLIGQYLQDEKIAADFAQYFDLFCKYRSDYQVTSILEGKASDDIKQRALHARFDERLALIGLMLDALRLSVQQVMDETAVTSRLVGNVTAFRLAQIQKKQPPMDIFHDLIEEKRRTLAAGRKAASISTDEQRVLRLMLEAMREQEEMLQEHSDTGAVQLLKADCDARVKAVKKHAEEVSGQMTHMFNFAELVFQDGQEMLILVTELTAGKDTAAFLGKYGNQEYFRHNKDLLLYERHGEIKEELKKVKLN